jgi:signal peptidase I
MTGQAATATKSKAFRPLVELPVLLAIAFAVAFIMKALLAQAFYIPSASMEPQLHIGDRVVVSKLAYQFHEPRRGDIVVFDSPEAAATQDDDAFPVRLFKYVMDGIGLRQPDYDVLITRVFGLPG